MRRLTLLALSLAVLAGGLLAWRGLLGQRDVELGEASARAKPAGQEQGPRREPELVAPPRTPRPASTRLAPPPRTDAERELLEAVEMAQESVNEAEELHAAGLVSADKVDDGRLELLRVRHAAAELTDVSYHQGRAEICARRLGRVERAHAAGVLDEGDLRDARLNLSEATAAASGTWDSYAKAWEEHFLWLQRRNELEAEAGRTSWGAASGALRGFHRARPAPAGISEEVRAALVRVTTLEKGSVLVAREGQEFDLYFHTVVDVRVGEDLIVSRGTQYVATIRLERVSGASGTARPVEGMQKLPIAAGDVVSKR